MLQIPVVLTLAGVVAASRFSCLLTVSLSHRIEIATLDCVRLTLPRHSSFVSFLNFWPLIMSRIAVWRRCKVFAASGIAIQTPGDSLFTPQESKRPACFMLADDM